MGSREKSRELSPEEEEAETGQSERYHVYANDMSLCASPHVLSQPFSGRYNHVFHSDSVFTPLCHFLEHRENKLHPVLPVSLARCVTLKQVFVISSF